MAEQQQTQNPSKPELLHHSRLSVGGGCNYSIFLSSSGLYSCGYNEYGQLGLGHTKNVPLPTRILLEGTVQTFSTGSNHVIALTADGSLFSWGANDKGQLGLGNRVSSSLPQRIPNFVPEGSHIIAIATGSNHNFALSSDNSLYGWGYNNDGELGTNHVENVEAPEKTRPREETMSFLEGGKILAIACGYRHTLCLTTTGLWSWGWRGEEEMGMLDQYAQHLSAIRRVILPNFDPLSPNGILGIACGGNRSFALTAHGVFGWGYNNYGGLGLGHAEHVNSPKKVILEGHPLGIACGHSHALALTTSGLFAWGFNSSGQLGFGNTQTVTLPKKVSLPPPPHPSGGPPPETPQEYENDEHVLGVACGQCHTLLVTTRGRVYGWGSNAEGGLGSGDGGDVRRPREIVGVSGVVAPKGFLVGALVRHPPAPPTVEQLGRELWHMRQTLDYLLGCNHSLQTRVETLEKELADLKGQSTKGGK